jgi:hypothetical protein
MIDLTYIEKTRRNPQRPKTPILLAIEIPELGAKAYRPDVNDDGGYIYYVERGEQRTDEIRMTGTSADDFRRKVREWAERKAEDLGLSGPAVLADGGTDGCLATTGNKRIAQKTQ